MKIVTEGWYQVKLILRKKLYHLAFSIIIFHCRYEIIELNFLTVQLKILPLWRRGHRNWLSARKKFKGGGEDNRQLVFQTIG